MMLFWSLSALLVIGALASVLWPLLRVRQSDIESAVGMGQALHDRQRNELQEEYANGLIDDVQLIAAGRELDSGYTESNDVHATDAPQGRATGLTAPAITLLLLPIVAVFLYLYLGSSEQVTADLVQDQTTGQHSVDDMVVRLKERLQREPEDAQGWMLLGRSYMMMKYHEEAAQAFENASKHVSGDSQLLADYAEALILASNNNFNEQADQLVNQALELQPDNAKALWIAGISAASRGDQGSAAQLWRKLLPLLPPGSEEATTLQNYIAEAAGGGSLELIPGGSTEETSTAPQNSQISAAQISVSVELSPELAANVSPDDTLFIFARAAQGPKMPLAIVRGTAADLPRQVVLDDAMAMMPQMKLSLFEQVVVEARISKSGNAIAQEGDLQGVSAALKVDSTAPVIITINQVVTQ